MEENGKYQSIAADQDLPQTVPPEQQEIENLKRERDDLYDRLLRKQAEFDNSAQAGIEGAQPVKRRVEG